MGLFGPRKTEIETPSPEQEATTLPSLKHISKDPTFAAEVEKLRQLETKLQQVRADLVAAEEKWRRLHQPSGSDISDKIEQRLQHASEHLRSGGSLETLPEFE